MSKEVDFIATVSFVSMNSARPAEYFLPFIGGNQDTALMAWSSTFGHMRNVRISNFLKAMMQKAVP